MNQENKTIFEKGLNIIKKLYFKPGNVMVTGSIALDILGVLPPGRIAHDIDFIIKMDDTTWNCLKLIEKINSKDDEDEKEDYPGNKEMITLTKDRLKINIWKYSPNGDWSDICDLDTGVMVATVNHIVKEKKSYGRPKDFEDIARICKNIL